MSTPSPNLLPSISYEGSLGKIKPEKQIPAHTQTLKQTQRFRSPSLGAKGFPRFCPRWLQKRPSLFSAQGKRVRKKQSLKTLSYFPISSRDHPGHLGPDPIHLRGRGRGPTLTPWQRSKPLSRPSNTFLPPLDWPALPWSPYLAHRSGIHSHLVVPRAWICTFWFKRQTALWVPVVGAFPGEPEWGRDGEKKKFKKESKIKIWSFLFLRHIQISQESGKITFV